ncbi:MAG: transposase family protein [Bacteriovoracaceae bacterium]|nr:transposase family protein [Bacteriovoracaceae bacterium]
MKKKNYCLAGNLYRIAKDADLLTKRSKTGIKRPLNREKPQLVATEHNQVWSWDVSQIKSECRSVRFYLYVIVDIWSRLVVGWVLEDHEKSEHAIIMWKKALEDQFITGKGLTNHKRQRSNNDFA